MYIDSIEYKSCICIVDEVCSCVSNVCMYVCMRKREYIQYKDCSTYKGNIIYTAAFIKMYPAIFGSLLK